MIAARIVGAVQVAVGATMLLVPERVADMTAGRGTPAAPSIVRLLGARIAGQGALTAARPSRWALECGAGVDGLHAASMLVLAVLAPRYRHTALVSAGVAAASIVGSLSART